MTIQEFQERLHKQLDIGGLSKATSYYQVSLQLDGALSWAEKTDLKNVEARNWETQFRLSKWNRVARVELCAVGIEISAGMIRWVAEENLNNEALSVADSARICVIKAVLNVLLALISDINSDDLAVCGRWI